MPRNDPTGHVPHSTLAVVAGIGVRAVRQDIADGAPGDTVERYLAWRAANRQPDRQLAPASGVNAETARLRRAQAEREELAVAERRGELVTVEEVRQILFTAGGIFASQLDALPGRLANELAAINDPALILARLRDECHRIRNAAAEELARAAADGAGEDGDAAATADTGPVGGPDSPPPGGVSGAGSVS